MQSKRNNQVIQEYLYDATGHMVLGKNLETEEKTEYGYNGLSMCVKNIQTLKNRPNSYQNHSTAITKPKPFRTKETSYVMDYLSGANNDLMSYEKGFGATKVTYGPGYERLNQTITLEPEAPVTPRMKVATNTIGKSYYQSDILGSPLLASNQQGELLRYSPRNPWGELTLPIQEDFNSAGVENSLLFTNYSYDSVLDHYFGQARFYDAKEGRMLAKDPVKRGLNPYPYCQSSPLNYVDPTGEVPHILVGGALGGLVGGAFGYVGSAISQKMNGERFNSKKAWGAAANGAVVGAVRGALVSSGVGLIGSLGANFGAGTLGSALEQKIGRGRVNIRESITNGLTNAVSGAIYGNNPLKGVGDAFRRGAAAGAATAAIQNLSNMWNPRNTVGSRSGRRGNGGSGGRVGGYTGGRRSPYTRNRNPRACGAPSSFRGGLGCTSAYGYQYQPSRSSRGRRENFSLEGFMKDVLLGAVMGGLSSAAFYGAGKGVEKLWGSLKGRSKGGSNVNSSSPMFGDDWHNYYNKKYGQNNVTWESASIRDVIDMPSKITNFAPNQTANLAQKSGWNVGPLGKGGFAGIPYKNGGGFSMHAPQGGSEYIQYHPGGGHHGNFPYYKVSSGKNGIVRYFIGGGQ